MFKNMSNNSSGTFIFFVNLKGYKMIFNNVCHAKGSNVPE